MLISIDVEKSFNVNQYKFLIKKMIMNESKAKTYKK